MLIVDIAYVNNMRSVRFIRTYFTFGNIKLKVLNMPAPTQIPQMSSQMYSLCTVSYFKIKMV